MFALVLVMSLQATESPAQNRTADLFKDCQIAVRFHDLGGQGDDAYHSRACMSYFEGFTDAVNFFEMHVCLDKATLGTVVRVFVKYVTDHPKLLDEQRELAVLTALANTYPCPTKK